MKYKHVNFFNVVLLCLISLFLGLMSASATQADSYTFVTKWGSYGSGDGQFLGVRGVAVDSSGNVYVSDWGNNRIQKFSSNDGVTYNLITKWGSTGSGDGQLVSPDSVSLGSSNNVYVADQSNSRIQKFDSSGIYLTQWGSYGRGDGQFNYPKDTAVDSSDNVYVADTYNNRIQKFSSSDGIHYNFDSYIGNQTSAIACSEGYGNGEFHHPCGVAVDSWGNVYVAERGNHRIQKFDSSGTYLTQWGSWGSGDGNFISPQGVAVDSSGNVYVADTGNNRILKFSSSDGVTYNLIAKWGSEGSDNGQFADPENVAIDSLGNVYVADTCHQHIQKFAIVKTIPTIDWENPADVIYGTALSNTQLNAVASVPGTFTYTPEAGNVLSAGTYALHVDFKPLDTTNYESTSSDATINVLKATPTITWNNPADILSGTALGDTQLNAVASVPGTFTYTPVAGTTLITGMGQTLHVDFKPSDITNYNSLSKEVTINVLTPAQGAQQTASTVQNLVDLGTINSGQGNSIMTKLNKAIDYLNLGDTKKAINELNAFINEVQDYVNNGLLSPADGQTLIDEANAIINAII